MSVKLRTRPLSDGRQSLYLDIYHNGERNYEYLNLYLTKDNKGGKNRDIRALAESIRAQRQLKLDYHEHGFAVKSHRKTSFRAFVEKQKVKRTPQTQRSWDGLLAHLKAYSANNDITFAQVTPQWVEGFKNFLLDRLGQNTAYHLFSILKTALTEAVREEIIQTNPAKRVKGISRKETHREYLEEEELLRLAATPCQYPDVKRAFLFACTTGLRHSDVRALRWKNIGSSRIALIQVKTEETQYIDLTAAAREYLGTSGGPEALVFQLPTLTTIETTLRKWAQAAGITKHVTFHVSRHTFATRLLTLGGDIYTVSKLLGHTSLAHTQVYAKIVDEKKRATLDLIPVVPLRDAS